MDVSYLKVSGRAAIKTLHARRAAYRTTGEYPFLIGDENELARVQGDTVHSRKKFNKIIADSMKVDLDAWLRRRRREAEKYDWEEAEVTGGWPSKVNDKGSIHLHTDVVSGKLLPEVYLGLVAIDEPWKLPAVLNYGDWNECPKAAVHCAFHRKWQAEFGSEIASTGGDVIECLVQKPPRTREAALELAWQHYWYCQDVVDQGCDTVTNLAAIWLKSNYWYFWWD